MTLSKETIGNVIGKLEHFSQNLKWTDVRGAQDLLAAADGLRELLERRDRDKQEPVAYMVGGYTLLHAHDPKLDEFLNRATALYAAPPAPVVSLPPEFISEEHGPVVQLEKLMAALAINGIKYERRFRDCDQSFGNSEQLNSPAVPDGWIMVPKRLTAENGAKAALIGEFNLEYSLTCHECFGQGCDDCSGEGAWTNTIPVDWTTIKDIWAKATNHFTAAPKQESE